MLAPRGARELLRPHTRADSPLRAWSAADQLVLDHLGLDDVGEILIVNDEFGALTVGLAESEPTVWTDSIVSRNAIDTNLIANGFGPLGERAIPGHRGLDSRFDTVILRLPKTASLLAHQIGELRTAVDVGTRVVAAGMARHIQRSTIDTLAKSFGRATPSAAVQKARLIHVDVDLAVIARDTRSHRWRASAGRFATPEGLVIDEAPGVFSTRHLDVGTSLLLDTLASLLPAPPHPTAIIGDLGCGNGVIAATLARRWQAGQFVCTDASDLAVAAARSTWTTNGLDLSRAEIFVADGFSGVADDSLDLVVTNPPSHQGHAVDHALTDRLMAEAARVLRPDGRLVAVAQRHLNLHTRLRRWFGSVHVPSKHPSHVVLVADDPAKR